MNFSKYSEKCDTDIDCKDISDEEDCDYLTLDEQRHYAKEMIPRGTSGDPCLRHINVSIMAFPLIETINMKFSADFYLNLRWYEPRIFFYDLNNVTSLNSLSKHDQNLIWTPQLTFVNSLGPYQTVTDSMTSGILIREQNPLPEDVTLPQEGNK